MKPIVTVLSVGPGDPDLWNQKTLRALTASDPVILRTGRHPVSAWLSARSISFDSLDDLYEHSEDFDSAYRQMAESVWKVASESGKVVYVVSDQFSDRSVDFLFRCRPECGKVEIVPGFSYADYYLSACRGLHVSGPLYLCSASDFNPSEYHPGVSLLLTEIDRDILAGDVKTALSAWLNDETPVCLLHGDAVPLEIPLYELDRQHKYSHLTALYLPGRPLSERSAYSFMDLMDVMNRLRAPKGCPWDQAQTHQSLRPYVVEEAWETVGAIDEGDPDHLAEELGDLLFQVVFHASIAASTDEFTIHDVLNAICCKMIRRHPHVFGNVHVNSAADVSRNWEIIKQQESGSHSLGESLDRVSKALPSLKYAAKVFKKTADFPNQQASPPALAEELLRLCQLLGQKQSSPDPDVLALLLLNCAHLCSIYGVDAEILLHQAVSDYISQIKKAENSLKPNKNP